MKLSNGAYRTAFVMLGIFLGMGLVGTGITGRIVQVFTDSPIVYPISYWSILAFGIIGILLSFRIPPR